MEDVNIIKDYFKENEVVELEATFSKKAYFKNLVMVNLVYLILWVLFDAFFIFIMFREGVSAQYWFIIIPVVGFNLLIIWAYAFKVVKDLQEQEKMGYVLTNYAVYKYNNGTYKSITQILIEDIIVVERSEYIRDGYYVASKNQNIKIINVNNEEEIFNKIAEKLKQD